MIIALCGHPGSGKSTIQGILHKVFGVEPIDDGWAMRDFAIRHLGASIDDVNTQEGKAKTITLPGGQTLTWRTFLGEFGNHIEALLGPDSIPEMAIMRASPGKHHSLGSVRREQGAVIRRHGGIVVGVRSAWAQPSPHEFDRFNESLVNIWIESQTRDLADLERRLVYIFGPALDPSLRDEF